MEDLNFSAFALCPLDGRYKKDVEEFSEILTEYGLVKNRVMVEVKWLKFLINNLKSSEILDGFGGEKLRLIYEYFDLDAYKRVKEIESVTNHDVKAVELYVAEKLKDINPAFEELKSFVHFGCTSEDINNVAYASMIKEGVFNVWIPSAEKLINMLHEMSIKYKDTPMLAHTHGQPATPTTVGKELLVPCYRLKGALKRIKETVILAKFNGATGNYSAVNIAFPEENWPALSQKFIEEELGFTFNPITTQIESHDYMCELFDDIRHFNNIMRDLDIDMWLYISMDYFKQKVIDGEVGSSVMPHKVNPIKFENSEGNIKVANALLDLLSNELPCSRMQRDLSDSTVLRNIAPALGYSLVAIKSLIRGLDRVSVNTEKLKFDLYGRWEILAEAIQTVLRKNGIPEAYDKLKELTRGKMVKREDIITFVESLDTISNEDKERLLKLTPEKYIGLAIETVDCNS